MVGRSIIAACAPNLRDLGGIPAADGRSIRRGIVYRSSHLAPPTEEVDLIRALGIKSVVDLRSTRERSRAPNTFLEGEGVDIVEFDIVADFRAAADPLDHLRSDPSVASAAALMRSVYRQLPNAAAPAVRGAAQLVVDGQVPLLVHCTAGKDRTGFVCAMLLLAAGVTREAVTADYLESEGRLHVSVSDATRRMMEQAGLDLTEAALEAINSARVDYLAESFAVLESDHGGPDAYIDALEIDCSRLRDAMLT